MLTGCSSIPSAAFNNITNPRANIFRSDNDRSDARVDSTNRAPMHYLKALMARSARDDGKALEEMLAAARWDPNEPRIRHKLVEYLVFAGDLDAALGQCNSLVALQPDRAINYLLCADLSNAAGHHDNAIQRYSRFLESYPDNLESLLKLGELQLYEGDNSGAIETCKEATRHHPDSFLARYYLARAQARSGQYDDALYNYRRVADAGSLAEAVFVEMGQVYEALENTEKAASYYERALEQNPVSIAGHYLGRIKTASRLEMPVKAVSLGDSFTPDPMQTLTRWALISREHGDYGGALLKLATVLAARPNDSTVRFFFALSSLEIGHVERGEANLRKIPPSSEAYDDARIQLGQLLFESERFDDAADAVGQLVKHQPQNERAIRLLIEIHEAAGRHGRALSVASDLVALDPYNDEYLYRLAWVHEKSGDRKKAVELLHRVIEMNPQNGLALNFLGYTYAEKGENLEEAERLVQRALEVHPDDGFFVDSLGWIYFQRGDYLKAVNELERARELAGNDPVIGEHLADAYAKVGRTDDALRAYRDAHARTDDTEQRQRVSNKLIELESSVRNEVGTDS